MFKYLATLGELKILF